MAEPRQARGRLLLYEPDGSVFDGYAAGVTGGFLDVGNLPPWETWICYVVDVERTRNASETAPGRHRPLGGARLPSDFANYLVSWVPPALVDVVSDAVLNDFAASIAWADEIETELTRLLWAAGMLQLVRGDRGM